MICTNDTDNTMTLRDKLHDSLDDFLDILDKDHPVQLNLDEHFLDDPEVLVKINIPDIVNEKNTGSVELKNIITIHF